MNMMNPFLQEQLRNLQQNLGEYIQKAGANIPEEIRNDPQAMVMHMIRTGQVSNPMMKQIMPMIQRMGGK